MNVEGQQTEMEQQRRLRTSGWPGSREHREDGVLEAKQTLLTDDGPRILRHALVSGEKRSRAVLVKV